MKKYKVEMMDKANYNKYNATLIYESGYITVTAENEEQAKTKAKAIFDEEMFVGEVKEV